MCSLYFTVIVLTLYVDNCACVREGRERGETRLREETIPTQGKQTNHRARLKADEYVKYRARTAANKALI